MEIFKRELVVPAEGLSAQAFFKHLQDIAGDQCVPLHLAGPDLEELGLMWVIIRYRVEVTGWPQPGERITLNTWPGRTRHGMMPRYYTVKDADGALRIAACAVWAVVDRHTRSMVNNEDYGITLEALETGEEIRLPGAIKKFETTRSGSFVVPPEYLDSNGHMNNTHYYTVAEQCIRRDARRDPLLSIATEHVSEALCGEELTIRWGEQDGLYFLIGEHEGKTVFRMNLQYA